MANHENSPSSAPEEDLLADIANTESNESSEAADDSVRLEKIGEKAIEAASDTAAEDNEEDDDDEDDDEEKLEKWVKSGKKLTPDFAKNYDIYDILDAYDTEIDFSFFNELIEAGFSVDEIVDHMNVMEINDIGIEDLVEKYGVDPQQLVDKIQEEDGDYYALSQEVLAANYKYLQEKGVELDLYEMVDNLAESREPYLFVDDIPMFVDDGVDPDYFLKYLGTNTIKDSFDKLSELGLNAPAMVEKLKKYDYESAAEYEHSKEVDDYYKKHLDDYLENTHLYDGAQSEMDETELQLNHIANIDTIVDHLDEQTFIENLDKIAQHFDDPEYLIEEYPEHEAEIMKHFQ